MSVGGTLRHVGFGGAVQALDVGLDLFDVRLGGTAPTPRITVGSDLIGSAPDYIACLAAFDLGGSLYVGGDVIGSAGSDWGDVVGSIVVAGDLVGGIGTARGGLAGSIQVQGALPASSAIVARDDLSGLLELGSCDGLIHVYGAIVNGAGIRIRGSLGSTSAVQALVLVDGGFGGASEYITVDYDGWDAGDDWGSIARVYLGQQEYSGNSPAARVYEVTPCKGDLDNDGDVDFDDIDPFVMALGTGYDAAYPGLAGSKLFHADLNCDGEIDFDDIDPFVARIGCCSPECGPCGDEKSAIEVAAGIRTHVQPAHLPTLRAAAARLAVSHPQAGRRLFWTTVRNRLAD